MARVRVSTQRAPAQWWRLVTVILLTFGVTFIGQSSNSVLAQIDCEPPADVAAASPAATPEPPDYSDAAFPEGGGELTIFAAASLVDVFSTIETQLEEANEGLDITVETAGSQVLVTQLTEGAEADVLATANYSTMATAIEGGLIDGDPVTFTGNRLVIVAPQDNPANIESLEDLAGDDVQLVVAGEDVPVGSYTRTTLCKYDASGDAPADLIEGINGNIVSEEVDVRDVLAKVQIGEADAGIVYASDAIASELLGTPLTVVEFPAELNTTATYPIAPVAGGDTDLAAAFIAYVLSSDGQTVLSDFGFELPS